MNKYFRNIQQDGDIVFEVNKGGTPTEVMRITGFDGSIATAGDVLQVDRELVTTARMGIGPSLIAVSEDFRLEIRDALDGYDFVIDNNGNVGLNQGVPTSQLHIVSTSTSNLVFQIENSTNNTISSYEETANGSGVHTIRDLTGSTKVQLSADLTLDSYLIASNVGLGTSTPTQKLHIVETTVSPASTAGQLVVENFGLSAISMVSDNDGSNALYFGDAANPTRGSIFYEHTSDDMHLKTVDNTTKLRLSGTGGMEMNIGPSNKRAIVGGIHPNSTSPQNILTVSTDNASGFAKIKFTSSRDLADQRGVKTHEMLTYWHGETKGVITTEVVRSAGANPGDPTFAWSGDVLMFSPSSDNGGGAWIMEIEVSWRSGAAPTIEMV